MAATARKADPALWEQVKREVTAGDRGGQPGQWSARKAQLAVQLYKKRGGEYLGVKGADNHLQRWTAEKWGTKSGKPSRETGERYLPERARARLTDAEYAATSEKKRRDTAAGKQFSAQPKAIAGKAASVRLESLTRAELLARAQGIPGRSRMRKAELIEALR